MKKIRINSFFVVVWLFSKANLSFILILLGLFSFVCVVIYETIHENVKISQSSTPTVVELMPLLEGEISTISHNFDVVNTTKGSLRIKKIVTSCTCSRAKADTMIILPRSKISLCVEADIRGREGQFASQCFLLFDDKSMREYELKTHIYKKFDLVPPHLFLYNIALNTPIERVIHVNVFSLQPIESNIKITNVSCDDNIDVSVLNIVDGFISERIHNKQIDLKVKLKPQAINGAGESKIEIQVPTLEGRQHRTIDVTWFIDSNYITTPSKILVRKSLTPENEINGEIVIVSKNQKCFAIKSVQADSTLFHIAYDNKRVSTSHNLSYTFHQANIHDKFVLSDIQIELADNDTVIRIPFIYSP